MKKEIKEFLLESNAIEGVHGEGALEDALRAWNYISDKSFLTPEVILGAHNFLSKNLDPRIAGFWRTCDVWIGGKRKIFISTQLIEEDIKALCNKINQSIKDKEKLTKKEGEKICKDAHINFEFIHPHEDYNGRVGRLIMNWHRSMLGLKILIIHTGGEQLDYYKWFKD